MPVKVGNIVKIEYEIVSGIGTVVSSSKIRGKPLILEIGTEQIVDDIEGIIEGLEEALIGMEKGEEKEVRLDLTDWYGAHDQQLIQKIPRDKFPGDQEVKPGTVLIVKHDLKLLDDPEWTYRARVTEVTSETVTVDFNHPLAGRNLIFRIKLVDILS